MAQFINPFPGMDDDGPLSEVELIQALRQGLAAEEEATHLYTLVAERSDNEKVKKVLLDIAREEQVHKGEFQQLLDELDPEEKEAIEEGRKEVEEMSDESEDFKAEEPEEESEEDESEDEEKEASTDNPFHISKTTLKKQLKQRLGE